MKGIHGISIAFLASCTVITANENLNQAQSILTNTHHYDAIPRVCPFPEKYPWNTTTNLPHESDCTKFYKCFLGKPILQDCPLMIKHDPISRLHYNRFEQVCDWPWRAGCISCPAPDENGNYPPSSSRISNGNDCGSYWECPIYGEPRLEYCERNMCFSRTCQRCVAYPEGGYCPKDGGSNPIICIDGERRQHHCGRTKYYECRNNEWYLQACDYGFEFDPYTEECTRCARYPVIQNE